MPKDDHVTVANIPGGYRVKCARCGAVEDILIQSTGMPVPVFTAWLDDIRKRHSGCAKVGDADD